MSTHDAGSALAIRDDQTGFTPQQIAVLRQIGVENASESDLAVFFHQAQRTGLDPFARQIYMVGRSAYDRQSGGYVTKYTIQTGIDGFRLIGRRAADARNEALEISDTEWCGKDGKWVDVWLSEEPPSAARVAIIRNGGRFPAVALFSEYAQYRKVQGGGQELTQMWASKGALMLAKCAEALAWRKAYPQDLSGLYTADEMSQADRTVAAQQVTGGHTEVTPSTSFQDAMAATDSRQPRDWEADIESCTNADELRIIWRDAKDAGILPRVESLIMTRNAMISDRIVEAEVVDEETGEIAP